jgi:hypothetical protein
MGDNMMMSGLVQGWEGLGWKQSINTDFAQLSLSAEESTSAKHGHNDL